MIVLRHSVAIDHMNDVVITEIAATLVELINYLHPKLAKETGTGATE